MNVRIYHNQTHGNSLGTCDYCGYCNLEIDTDQCCEECHRRTTARQFFTRHQTGELSQ